MPSEKPTNTTKRRMTDNGDWCDAKASSCIQAHAQHAAGVLAKQDHIVCVIASSMEAARTII